MKVAVTCPLAPSPFPPTSQPSHYDFELVTPLDEADCARAAAAVSGRGQLEGEWHPVVGAEVGLELCGDVDRGRAAGGVLHHQEELGDDLDDVARLQDEVALA